MKRFNLLTAVILLSLLCACESYYQPEEDVICLPLNMSATEIQGAETKKLIADFTYIPGTDLLDHITWSNNQSHFFNYDEFGRLQMVIYMKVDARVQEEMWLASRDMNLPRRECRRSLPGRWSMLTTKREIFCPAGHLIPDQNRWNR